jgi:hypothetical protein
MSSKARRKERHASVERDERIWSLKTIAVLAGILIAVSLFLFALTALKRSRVESIPREFEGRIVDKWAGFNETQQGSYPYYRISVEVDGQQPFSVPVNEELYQQAQRGMILKRSEEGLEILRGPTK